MTSEITEEMVEAGKEALWDHTDVYMDGCTVVRTGAVEAVYSAMLAAAFPQGENVGGVVDLIKGRVDQEFDREAHFSTAEALSFADLIASLSAKVAEVERERDRAGLRAEEQWAGWVKADVAKRNAEARASELRREVERLRKAIDDALGRHQVTHIHAGLRAALQQEGESDA